MQDNTLMGVGHLVAKGGELVVVQAVRGQPVGLVEEAVAVKIAALIVGHFIA